MQNRVPLPRDERPALPDFAPVPRKTQRHDGWTPARQKAFIEALADCGSVRRAAGFVNMSQANAYALRRAAGAEGFRRAWDAALDYGLLRLKDEAFERAMEGELIPVFQNGKLMGYRRKRNDALLMFCLRHYGQDASGRRTTINYFSTRATAGAVASPGTGGEEGAGAGAAAQASTTLRTVTTGGEGAGDPAARALADDSTAAAVSGFAGVTLDAAAEAAIAAALADFAERRAAADAAIEEGGSPAMYALADDPGEHFVRTHPGNSPYVGVIEPPLDLVSFDDPWVEPGEGEA